MTAVGSGVSPVFMHNKVSGGVTPHEAYLDLLVNTYGSNEVWPLVDIESGTTITAFVNPNRNGSLTGWALQNAAGPVSGTLAPLNDGINDWGDILTSNGLDGYEDIYDGDNYSVATWVRVFNAGVWTDSTNRWSNYTTTVGTVDQMGFRKRSSPFGGVRFTTEANSEIDTVTDVLAPAPTTWMLAVVTSSLTDGIVKGYINDAQIGTAPGRSTAWSAAAFTRAVLGAQSVGGGSGWYGWVAYHAVKFGYPVWSLADVQGIYNGVT